MNRRRMMMLQQSKNYEVKYLATSGTLPIASDWTFEKVKGNDDWQYEDNYLHLYVGSGQSLQRISPANRKTAETPNCSISATVKVSKGAGHSITLYLSNGVKAAFIQVRYAGTATPTTTWKIAGANTNGEWAYVANKQVDIVNNFAKLELVLLGDTYNFYINDKLIFTDLARTKGTTHIDHNSDSTAGWYVSEMTYKEW